MTATKNDFQVCDRCGAMVLTPLAAFHICKGTDMHRRPANVPIDVWNAALMKTLGAQQVIKTVQRAKNRDEAAQMRKPTIEDRAIDILKAFGLSAILGGALWMLAIISIFLWKMAQGLL